MAKGSFRPSKNTCFCCGKQNKDKSPMKHKIGNKHNPDFICDDCNKKIINSKLQDNK